MQTRSGDAPIPILGGRIVGGAAVLLLALATRLIGLTSNELWLDEANSVFIAKGTYQPLLDAIRFDSSPPLYYAMLRVWMFTFGDDPFAVRALSVLGSVVLVALVYFMGPRIVGARAGSLSALFLAISPASIDYAQQARQYTWTQTAVFLALWSFVRWRDLRNWQSAVTFGITLLTGLYLHNFCLHVGLVLGVYALIEARKPEQNSGRSLLQLAGIGLIIALGYSPWLPALVTQLKRSDYLYWVDSLWSQGGVGGILSASSASFCVGPPWTRQTVTPAPELWVTALLVTSILIQSPRTNGYLLQALLIAPMSSAVLGSLLLGRAHFIPGRVDQLLLPVFGLLVGSTCTQLSYRARFWPLVTVLFLCSSVGLWRLYSPAPSEGAKTAARTIDAAAKNGDRVLVVGLLRAPIEYYLRRANSLATVSIGSFPPQQELHMGNIAMTRLLADRTTLRQSAHQVAVDAVRQIEPQKRLFLVLPSNKTFPLNRELVTMLARTRRAEPIKRWGPFYLNRGPSAEVVVYQGTR